MDEKVLLDWKEAHADKKANTMCTKKYMFHLLLR